MKVGMYPGSFCPISYGHMEIANRAAPLFDKFHISIGINRQKTYMFSVDERIAQIRRMVSEYGTDELKAKIEVDSYSSLLMTHVHAIGAKWIVRGLRPVSDFESEFVLDGVNHSIDPTVETIFLISSPKFQFVSSSVARELAAEKENVSWLVPDFIENAIHEKLTASGLSRSA